MLVIGALMLILADDNGDQRPIAMNNAPVKDKACSFSYVPHNKSTPLPDKRPAVGNQNGAINDNSQNLPVMSQSTVAIGVGEMQGFH